MRAQTALSHLASDHAAPLQRLTVIRPFLRYEKRHLREYCEANCVPWVEDPTNSDPRFMRSRHRTELSGMASETRGLVRR